MSSVMMGPQKPLIAGRSGLLMSHSRKQTMLTCGKKYQYNYIDRLEPVARSSNLGYGSAIHTAISAYLTAQAFGATIDPIEIFNREWAEFCQGDVSYSSVWDEQKLIETGKRSLEVFLEDWAQRGWTPIMDVNGLPVIERQLEVLLPNGVRYLVILDTAVRDQNDKVIILDFKTPAAASIPGFASLSDQLIGYQVAVEAHKDELGIQQVDGLAFYELLKRAIPKTSRGDGPKIHVEEPSLPRNQQDIDEWVSEVGYVARDIMDKRFYKRPMDSFNSPCQLCDFQKKCMGLPDVGLRKKPDNSSRLENSAPLQVALVK